MSDSNFVDYVKIYARSGNGGAGSCHMRREKYVARGGPDGGDGGRGGHVILRGNKQLWTLLHLKYNRHVFADNGMPGSKQCCTGVSGKDVYIEVPLGTVAKDPETGQVLFEITENEETKILMQGGRGGLGNTNFKTAVNQAPTYCQPGEEGKENWVILELKVLADVGLVGFPNAGKSTLLSVLSAAKPKIADYPFTTLVPNLGIVKYHDYQSFVIADIPGIIEGAHEGKGLGIRFLKHIERNPVLLFMVPADSKDIKTEYEILLNELKQHNPELLLKKKLLAITKTDLLDDELKTECEKILPEINYVFISSITGTGLNVLKNKLWKLLNDN